MKKCVFIGIIALLAACDKTPAPAPATPKDMQTVAAEMKKNDESGIYNPVLTVGTQGDFLIKLAETPQLLNIAKKAKHSQFLSISNPRQYVEDGYCLVNIVPFNTMKQIGTPNSTCHYRLFCGNAKEMDYTKPYAVELCSE